MKPEFPDAFRDHRGLRFHQVGKLAGGKAVYRSVDIGGSWRLDDARSRMPVPADEEARREAEARREREVGG